MTSEMLPCANSDKMHATTTKVSSDLSMTFIQFLKGMPEIHKPLRVILCISLLVCSAASTALIPKMMGRLIDSKEDRSQLEKELYIFFGVVAFNFVALAAREFSSRLLSEKIIKELRIRVFSCFVEADMEFFDRNGVGNLIGKLSNDVNQAESCSTDTVLEGLSNALLFLSNLALLIQISLNMSIVIILSLPLYVYITLVFSQRTKRISKKYNKVLSMSQDFMEQRFANILTIAAFRRQDIEILNLEKFTNQAIQLTKQKAFYHAIYGGITSLVPNLAIIISLLVGIHLVVENRITQGELTTYLLIGQEISSNAINITKSVAFAASNMGSLSKLFKLLSYTPKINLRTGKMLNLSQANFDIEFRDVSFNYQKSTTLILNDVNLHIHSGEFVGVVGSSGSGKSTMLKMLLRLYDPTEGEILLNGVNIKDYLIRHYHNIIGYVSQQPTLFSGTIRDNILYGKPDATQEQLDSAIQMAGLGFVSDFRKGILTQIGERGTKLSGGQKQRVSIARALIRRPKILVFDEATSALDSQSEKLIQRSIEHIVSETKSNNLNMTVIVIAHRLSTVRQADKIVVLDKGIVSSCGNHQYLMQHDDIYNQLIHMSNSDIVKHDDIHSQTISHSDSLVNHDQLQDNLNQLISDITEDNEQI